MKNKRFALVLLLLGISHIAYGIFGLFEKESPTESQAKLTGEDHRLIEIFNIYEELKEKISDLINRSAEFGDKIKNYNLQYFHVTQKSDTEKKLAALKEKTDEIFRDEIGSLENKMEAILIKIAKLLNLSSYQERLSKKLKNWTNKQVKIKSKEILTATKALNRENKIREWIQKKYNLIQINPISDDRMVWEIPQGITDINSGFQKLLNNRTIVYSFLVDKKIYIFAQIWKVLKEEISTDTANQLLKSYKKELNKSYLPLTKENNKLKKWKNELEKNPPKFYSELTDAEKKFKDDAYDPTEKEYDKILNDSLSAFATTIKNNLESINKNLRKEEIQLATKDNQIIVMILPPKEKRKSVKEIQKEIILAPPLPEEKPVIEKIFQDTEKKFQEKQREEDSKEAALMKELKEKLRQIWLEKQEKQQ